MTKFQVAQNWMSARSVPSSVYDFYPPGAASQQILIPVGVKIPLEIKESGGSRLNPSITANPAKGLAISVPKKMGPVWMFTVTAASPGETTLQATIGKDATGVLKVVAGSFKDHPLMEKDLIADAFRGGDPRKINALTLMLNNVPNHIFNENGKYNLGKWGELACGTVSKAGGQALFFPALDYTYGAWHKTIPPKKLNGRNVWKIDKREEVQYDEKKIDAGMQAIRNRLKKGQPTVAGLTYGPDRSIQQGGSLRPNGSGGHSALIVGCNAAASRFLYIDVWGPTEYPVTDKSRRGSHLKYEGGVAGVKAFADECEYLGIFERKTEKGRTLLRQDPNTQSSGGMFENEQFLEVIAGPL